MVSLIDEAYRLVPGYNRLTVGLRWWVISQWRLPMIKEPYEKPEITMEALEPDTLLCSGSGSQIGTVSPF